MEKTITINQSTMIDLMRLSQEMQDKIESLQLMNDKEFMDSLKKSDEQVKKREFADWNAL